jgi:hypothetical protein
MYIKRAKKLNKEKEKKELQRTYAGSLPSKHVNFGTW